MKDHSIGCGIVLGLMIALAILIGSNAHAAEVYAETGRIDSAMSARLVDGMAFGICYETAIAVTGGWWDFNADGSIGLAPEKPIRAGDVLLTYRHVEVVESVERRIVVRVVDGKATVKVVPIVNLLGSNTDGDRRIYRRTVAPDYYLDGGMMFTFARTPLSTR